MTLIEINEKLALINQRIETLENVPVRNRYKDWSNNYAKATAIRDMLGTYKENSRQR